MSAKKTTSKAATKKDLQDAVTGIQNELEEQNLLELRPEKIKEER